MQANRYTECSFLSWSMLPLLLVQHSIHQPVSVAVVAAQDVLDGKTVEATDQFLRASKKLLQPRIFHAVLALHLFHQQLRIADYLKRGKFLLLRIFEGRYQAGVFGKIVRLNAQILCQLSQRFSLGTAHNHAVGGGAWIAPRATVYVCRDGAGKRALVRLRRIGTCWITNR